MSNNQGLDLEKIKPRNSVGKRPTSVSIPAFNPDAEALVRSFQPSEAYIFLQTIYICVFLVQAPGARTLARKATDALQAEPVSLQFKVSDITFM